MAIKSCWCNAKEDRDDEDEGDFLPLYMLMTSLRSPSVLDVDIISDTTLTCAVRSVWNLLRDEWREYVAAGEI